MNKLFLILALTGSTIAFAQQKVIPLYKGDAPGSEGWNWKEGVNDSNAWHVKVVYNVTHPSLTVFMPIGKPNGTAMIICPGGGFQALSINSEGFDAADWLAKKGITCFVLKYRLNRTMGDDPTKEFAAGRGQKEREEQNKVLIPMAVADGRAAIAYVRSHASEYGIDPHKIGMMGFSAGGTVAASSAFGYTAENKPDFVAPIYAFMPAEMMGPVADDAPPMFLLAASDDFFGLQTHSVGLYTKWNTAKKPVEIHIYSKGNHGFGMKTQHLPTDQWIERFMEWLWTVDMIRN